MPLKLRKRGEIWHYSGTVAGRRLRGSTKTAQKGEALRIANKLETDALECDRNGPENVLTFAQAAILYRNAQKPDRFLDVVEDHWKNTLVKDITSGSVRQAAILLMPRAGGATRNRNFIVPTQAIADQLVHRWNCHEEMLAALKAIEAQQYVGDEFELVRAAIAKAERTALTRED